MEEWVGSGGEEDDGRGEVEVIFVGVAPRKDRALGAVQQGFHALPGLAVHDAAVIGCVPGTRGEEFGEGGFQFGEELVEDGGVDEGVVLREADLPGVNGLAPEESARGDVAVGLFGHDGWVAAAQFQCHGRECFCGLFGDDGAHVCGAGVEYLVPFLLQEESCFGDPTLHDFVT